jgi:adenylate cyclase
VIGDNVNVASRLTSLAKGGEILISKKTYDAIGDNERLQVEERGKVPVKGRRRQIAIYRVLSLDRTDYNEPKEDAAHA